MPSTSPSLRIALSSVATGAFLAAGLAVSTLHAQAVSGGGYDPAQQGCSKTADRNDRPQSTEPGCHNATLQLNAGSGSYAQRWHVVSVNSDQLANGESPHAGSIAVDPGQGTAYMLHFDTGTGTFILVNPIGFATDVATWVIGGGQGPFPLPQQLVGAPGQPSAGLSQSNSAKRDLVNAATNQQVYFGADDNLDNGEHDGVNPTGDHRKDARVANGPSDGGAIQANTHVQGSAADPTALITKNVDPTDMHNPVRAADAGTGACADGLCAGADTSRRKAYQGGCTSCPDQSVYNDQNSTDWRSPDCNSGSTANQNDCGANWQSDSEQGNIYQPYSERGAYYTDPGVFVYEDPDPQASPIGSSLQYPICELYAGTMGVWVCSMQVVPSPGAGAPASPSAPASDTPQRTTAHVQQPNGAMTGGTATLAPNAQPQQSVSGGSALPALPTLLLPAIPVPQPVLPQ